MRYLLLTFTFLLLTFQTFSSAHASAENIADHWAYETLRYSVDNGILKGDEHNNLNPDKTITRAEYAATLVRALKLTMDPANVTSSFPDVKKDDWFYNEVSIANTYKLIKGDDKGYFNPQKNISREEMAVILKRAVDHYGYPTVATDLTFKDKAKISSWAVSDVSNILSLNLMKGQDGDLFAPLASSTRAEAATVIHRLLVLEPVEQEEPAKPEEPVEPEKPAEQPSQTGKEILKVTYNFNYAEVLKKQAEAAPKVDGQGLFTASEAIVSYYLNPGTYNEVSPVFYQFLKLDSPVANLTAELLNTNTLSNKGILSNTGEHFITAGAANNLNEFYLLSHALHETNNGKSELSTGIEVGIDENSTPTMVTEENRALLTEIKTTYNVYGVGAKDSAPLKLGSEYAYAEKWFSIPEAIIGGAKFIGLNYVNAGQNTLYKMKWNPDRPATHQYATHVQWAEIQAKKIADIYIQSGADKTTASIFEVPSYLAQLEATALPAVVDRYAVNTTHVNVGKTGKAIVNALNMRTYPNTNDPASVISKLAEGTPFTIIGENSGWYKVDVNGVIGWLIGEYVTLDEEIVIASVK